MAIHSYEVLQEPNPGTFKIYLRETKIALEILIGTVCQVFLAVIQKAQVFFDTLLRLPCTIKNFINSFNHSVTAEEQIRAEKHSEVHKRFRLTLLDAAYFHQNNELKQLLKSSCANTHDVDGATPLHAAASVNNLEGIKILVSDGANINAVEMHKQTALHWAASQGSITLIHLLASLGATIDATDEAHETPLHKAAQRGHLEAVSALIALGANINHLSEKRQNPYFDACLNGQMPVAQYLRDLGAHTETSNRDNKKPADVYGRAGLIAFIRQLFSSAIQMDSQVLQIKRSVVQYTHRE